MSFPDFLAGIAPSSPAAASVVSAASSAGASPSSAFSSAAPSVSSPASTSSSTLASVSSVSNGSDATGSSAFSSIGAGSSAASADSSLTSLISPSDSIPLPFSLRTTSPVPPLLKSSQYLTTLTTIKLRYQLMLRTQDYLCKPSVHLIHLSDQFIQSASIYCFKPDLARIV